MSEPVLFGKYLLLDRVAVGGMAEVFKARPLDGVGIQRLVAIKRILPSIAEDADFIQMFVDEAKITGQLNHKNIAQVYELGRVDAAHFIVMEYICGKDLLQVQNRLRRLKQVMNPDMAAFIASCLCAGLDYAHKKVDSNGNLLGIVHRDISPQNLLISYAGDVKVIDFGIAKAASRATKTQAGIIKGKFGYMSPEQTRGLPLDRRSDIFAVGTILHEMLTGVRLFYEDTDFATLEKVHNCNVPLPSTINPSCPPQLEIITMRALTRNLEDRYQWAIDMYNDLQGYLQGTRVRFTAAHLAGWMRQQFSADLERDRALLEQERKSSLPANVDAGSSVILVQGVKRPPVGAKMGQSAGATMALGMEDIELEELGLAEGLPAAQAPPPGARPLPFSSEPVGGGRGAASPAASSNNDGVIQIDEFELTPMEDAYGGTDDTDTTPLTVPGVSALSALEEESTPPLELTDAMHSADDVDDATPLSVPSMLPSEPRPQRASGSIVTSSAPAKGSLLFDILLGIGVAVVIVGAVLGGRAFIAPRRAPGTMVITVLSAARATMNLDGVEHGAVEPGSVVTIKYLPSGGHRLALRSPHGSFEQTVSVLPGGTAVVNAVLGAAVAPPQAVAPAVAPPPPPTVVPPQAMGHLRVVTDPPEAEVHVGGKMLGVTPLTLGNFDPTKDVLVTVQKNGYLSISSKVSFAQGAQQVLELKLAPSPGAAKEAKSNLPRELPKLAVPVEN